MNDPDKKLAEALMLTEQAINQTDALHYEEGEELLRKALTLAPDNETILKNYVEFCLTIAYNNLCAFQKYHEAIRYFRKALEHTEGTAETWMDLGTAYANNDEPLETLEAWTKALDMMDTANKEDRLNIERLLENIRMVQKAVEGRKSRKRHDT